MILNVHQRLMADKITKAVCVEFGISEDEIKSKTIVSRIAKPRRTAIMIMNENNIPFSHAAKIMGITRQAAGQCGKTAKKNCRESKVYRKSVYTIVSAIHNTL